MRINPPGHAYSKFKTPQAPATLPLNGHDEYATRVTCSRDDTRIVGGTGDKIVKVPGRHQRQGIARSEETRRLSFRAVPFLRMTSGSSMVIVTTNASRTPELKEKGRRVTEIAQALGVTRQTVHRHLRGRRRRRSSGTAG